MDVYPRLIPTLLLSDGRLVKTRRFAEPVYVGDPVNILSIFNDFEVDEIVLLDIDAARSRVPADLDLLRRLATECFIPLAYGGAVESSAQARRIVAAGFEKVVVNTVLLENPDEVRAMVDVLGSQAVVASADVRSTSLGYEVHTRGATVATGLTVEAWARHAEEVGVGEVLVTSVDQEGTRSGLDLDLIKHVTAVVNVPVIAHGGAGSRADLVPPVRDAQASAVAAGSQFVLQSGRASVLVNYPTREEIGRLFRDVAAADGGALAHAKQRVATAPQRMVEIDEQRTCRRCLITDDVPGSALDDSRECHYCRLHDTMEAQYPTGDAGRRELERMAEQLKAAGRGKRYDCILGVSGGCDSSYLAHLLIELGVRPLAVHFDNTWNSPIATSNIYTVLGKLGIELESYVADNVEYDDIYKSFMLAGVKDIEAPTDIGFMGVLYRAAEKHGVKHIIEGHSFRTEGVSPLGWLYMDGGYVKSVHEAFGTVPLKTYPNMDFAHFMKWTAFSRIERLRPLYYLDYQKEQVKHFLEDTYGWQWYGGHHLENRFTAFYHSYFLPTRFGIDFRQIELSALVRSGQVERREAASRLQEERVANPELIALVKKRLGWSDEEFEDVMSLPKRSYREFATYKRRFERLRPFFWVMYKLDRVPKSFYVKFCLKTTSQPEAGQPAKRPPTPV